MISAIAHGDEPVVNRRDLPETLGMDPGLASVITLRSLLK